MSKISHYEHLYHVCYIHNQRLRKWSLSYYQVRQFLLPPCQLAGQEFVELLDGADTHGLKVLRPSGIVLETREDARIPHPDFEVKSSFCQIPSMRVLMSRLAWIASL